MKKASTQKRSKVLSVSTPTDYEKDGEQRTAWNRIGSAFEGEKGMTVILNALPLSGKLFISEVNTDTK